MQVSSLCLTFEYHAASRLLGCHEDFITPVGGLPIKRSRLNEWCYFLAFLSTLIDLAAAFSQVTSCRHADIALLGRWTSTQGAFDRPAEVATSSH
jgi:hypothetical protein